MKRHQMHPNYHIIAAAHDMPADLPESSRNFRVIPDPVDATQLHTSKHLKGQQFDAIIFNNPHIKGSTRADTEQLTRTLIDEFIYSAGHKLAPVGKIHINVTQSLLDKYPTIHSGLGLGSYGKTSGDVGDYSALYVPCCTKGGLFPPYANHPEKARMLRSFIFPK